MTARRLLVKFVRANGLLAALAASPACLAPVVVIRHPLATVASQLREGSWTRPTAIDFDPFVAAWPDHGDAVRGLSRPEEYLAAAWAADVVAAAGDAASRPWWVVHYEHLRRDPEATLGPVIDGWGIVAAANADWDRPSRTARGAVRDLGGHGLDAGEIDRVLEVVRRFGVTAYDAEPDPVAPLPSAPSSIDFRRR